MGMRYLPGLAFSQRRRKEEEEEKEDDVGGKSQNPDSRLGAESSLVLWF